MKMMRKTVLALVALMLTTLSVKAIGWPSGFEGVMLQGFWWDSYQTDTKWTKLEAKADEYSQYFKLIWVPNSGKSTGGLGYMPIYWFSNHNSDMGSQAQLVSMIKTYKAKGTGIIADVVINHRAGMSTWINFPTETWRGVTYHIGLDGICRNDEVNNPGNPGGATGAYDEGENFDGARDLDHTNANVQNNCKNYCKFLLEELGYAGFRLDMVKGYAGYYTKMYNQYAKPTYSVGEYWDGNYDAVANWIENTGGESAAFDFPQKYCINDAFRYNDMTKLSWKSGSSDQPAGLAHGWYRQLSVTFIDNHDTYRDGSKFPNDDKVVAANAFILMNPGTPCVFLPHYNAHKSEIQQLIKIRNSAGITNTSEVEMLQLNNSCYMAKVKGSKGDVVVKIGPAMVSPSGYADSDIKASGTDYCVWTKVAVTSGNGSGSTGGSTGGTVSGAPSSLYLMGDLQGGHWQTNVGIKMTKSGNKFTASNVKLEANEGETKAYFSFVTALGTTGSDTEWDGVINGSDRYGATAKDQSITVGTAASMSLFAANVNASSAYSWGVTPGTYTVTADFDAMTVTVSTGTGGGGSTGGDTGSYPAHIYLLSNGANYEWDTTAGVEAKSTSAGVYEIASYTIYPAGEADTNGYLNIVTTLGADWDAINEADRYGALEDDAELALGITTPITVYPVNVSAMGAKSYKVAAGTYHVVIDLKKNTITITTVGGSTGGNTGGDTPQPAKRGDVNEDGDVNISDAQEVIDIMLNN